MTATLALLFTLAFLPVYLVLRSPFLRLPLHVDTCFYVSNHTICHRRFAFARGWNAHLAGCSKVIPELFYTLIYLRRGPEDYKVYSRLYASLYNYGSAVLVGYAAYRLGGGVWALFYFGLVAYALISSHPHYGVYFENAELLEIPFLVGGFLFVAEGLTSGRAGLVAAGVGVWAFDGFFIKLSSLVSGAVLAAGAVALFPASFLPAAGASLAVALLYALWVTLNGQPVGRLIAPLVRHESYSGHRLAPRTYALQTLRKLGFLWDIGHRLPVIPGLAILGAVVAGARQDLLLLYLLAVGLAYLLQAALVWYYAIPFLPGLAMLAAFGTLWLIQQGPRGMTVTVLLGLLWLVVHGVESFGRLRLGGLGLLNLHVWEPYGAAMATKNAQLEEIAPSLAAHVGGASLFVYGAWSQVYVLLGSSYDVPFVCAARWLDHMIPGWQRALNERLVQSPPAFLLDTEECLDVGVLRERLCLDYTLVASFPSQFRLFALNSSCSSGKVDLDARPFVAGREAPGERPPAAEMEARYARARPPLRSPQEG